MAGHGQRLLPQRTPPEAPNYGLVRSEPVNSPLPLTQYRLRRCKRGGNTSAQAQEIL